MATPGGVVVTAPLPPPPPQLAAHTVIKKIAVIRANVAVNIEIPIYTALLELLSHTRRLLATTDTLPDHLLSNRSVGISRRGEATGAPAGFLRSESANRQKTGHRLCQNCGQ